MRLVFGLVLFLGIGLAGFAVYMAQNYIGGYEAALAEARSRTAENVPVQMIYVSTKEIPYGHEITEEDIRLAPWPQEILPEGAFTEATPLVGQGIERRVALRTIDPFEAMLPTKVSEPGGSAGLGSHLKPGESAFAISVDVASGVSGFLRPGDRVDVYWTGRVAAADLNGSGEVTKLIQTGIRLIAIDQSADSDVTKAAIARTVTVAASREQVATLTHAQSTGKLTLSLIGVTDMTTTSGPIEVDQLSMLGIERSQAPAPEAAPESCFTKVRKGADVQMIPRPCN